MAGGIYRSLYDFKAESENDLEFNRGDFIKVIKQINNEWYEGTTDTSCGQFPATYVECVLQKPCDKIAVAINSFTGQESGDITFFKGDVIGIIENIDSNWLNGFTDTDEGIFPVSFIQEIDFCLPSDLVNNNNNSVHASDTVITNSQTTRHIPWAEAIDDFTAQDSDELTIKIGDGIELIKEIDSFWSEGIVGGKQGKFPSTFIKVITELPEELKFVEKSNNVDTENGLIPNAKALYMFVGTREGELSFDKGDIIMLTQRISQDWLEGKIGNSVGIFPSNHVKIIVDLPFNHVSKTNSNDSFNSNHTSQNQKSKSMPMKAKVIACTIPPARPQRTTPSAEKNLPGSQRHSSTGQNRSPPKRHSFRKPPAPKSPMRDIKTPRNNTETVQASPEKMDKHKNTPGHNGMVADKNSKKTFSLKPKKKSLEKQSDMYSFELTEEQIFHMDAGYSNTNGNTAYEDNKPPKPKIPARSASMSKPNGVARSKSMTYKPKAPARPGLVQNSTQDSNPNKDDMDLLSTSPPKPYKRLPKPLAPMPSGSVKPVLGKERPNTLNVGSSGLGGISPVRSPSSPRSSINHKSMAVAFTKDQRSASPSFNDNINRISRSETDPSLHRLNVGKGAPTKQPLTPEHVGSEAIKSLYFATSSSSALTPSPDKRSQTLDAMLQRSSSLRCSNKPNLSASRKKTEIKDDSAPSSHHGSSDSLSQTSQSQELKRVDMEIAELKSKIESEAHLLSGVETLLDFVSDDKRADLLVKQEQHKTRISELNDDLNALEDEKSFLLASFGKLDDVKNRVAELEKQIETYLDNCEQLRRMQDVSVIEELPEIRDNIEFCENMVDTLQDELNGLREKLVKLGEIDQVDGIPDPEVQLTKRKNKQKKVIEELIKTEESYTQDISLLADVMKYLEENENTRVNTEMLFGNLPLILHLSTRLFTRFKNADQDELDVNGLPSRLASCFIDMAAEMKECYSSYCHNYEEAIGLLEKYEEDISVSSVLTNAVKSVCNGREAAPFILSSFLIKPVQRVLKYPLLLSELNKNHVGEGLSKEVLKEALTTVTDVATAINEFKRRKDLVQKYRETEDGIGKKVQKLNWHSVAKKSSRINQRITQFTGLNSQTVDETFNEQEKRFRGLEKLIKAALKNIVQFVEEFKESAGIEKLCAESIRQFYDEEVAPEEVLKYYTVVSIIAEQYSNETVTFIQDHVTEPLSQLVQLFQGPFRLIQKRNDKCLDYDRAKNKAAKAKYTKERDKINQTQEELTLNQNIYLALNTQLLEELPTLCYHCSSVIKYCLTNFVEAQRRYLNKAFVQMHDLWQLPFVVKDSDTMERHQELIQKAMVQLASLAFIPANLHKDTTRRSQTQVVSSALVKASFFVDFDEAPDSTSPTHPLIDLSSDNIDTVDQALTNIDLPPKQDSDDCHTTCVVKFSFEAECDAEISAVEGTVVNVLRKCDKTGNPEWWLVEQNGRKGYIPQAFLGEEKRTRSFSDLNFSVNGRLKQEPLIPIRNTSDITNADKSETSQNIHVSNTTSDEGENVSVDSNMVSNVIKADNDNRLDVDSRSLISTASDVAPSFKSSVTSDGEPAYDNVSHYAVEYDFEALHQGELSVKEGTVLTVLQKYDQKGNEEWWYVEYDGQQGYVPRDYLVFVDESQMC